MCRMAVLGGPAPASLSPAQPATGGTGPGPHAHEEAAPHPEQVQIRRQLLRCLSANHAWREARVLASQVLGAQVSEACVASSVHSGMIIPLIGTASSLTHLAKNNHW